MINRLFILTVLALIGFLAYEQAAIAAVVPACPCDTQTVDGNGGLTGNEILDMVCPGGQLIPGGEFTLLPNRVSVFTEDPVREYLVVSTLDGEILNFDCIIEADDDGFRVPLGPDGFESCRERLISACNLGPSSSTAIPTLSEWGLIATAGVLGLVGIYAVRRRRAAV